MTKMRITECMDINLEQEMWSCNKCSKEIISARESYLKGCLVYERPASEIYGAPMKVGTDEAVSYAPNPDFMRVLEFYCPYCGMMVHVQNLPAGHPIQVDIELDIDKLKEKYSKQKKQDRN